MQIQIKGLTELQASLGQTRNQIPFALAQAINDTAKDVQNFELQTQLPSKLTLRSKGAPWQKPGSRFGINIKPFATKAKPMAIIGSQADWLKLQEEGGIKTGKGHRIAIEHGARPGKTDVIPARLKPRALLRQAGQTYKTRGGKVAVARRAGAGFILRTKSGPAVYIRTGPGRAGMKLMYFLEPSASVPAVLKFFESGREVVVEKFPAHFATRFKAALVSAKPRK